MDPLGSVDPLVKPHVRHPFTNGCARLGRGPLSVHTRYGSKGEDNLMRAYILIQTEIGQAAEVAERVRGIDGVEKANDVAGPYDVIVQAEAEDTDALGTHVVAHIQRLDGIARTLTCPIVNI